MKNEMQHTDDFKKLFDPSQMPELPANLEEQLMASIEVQKLKDMRKAPYWFTKNLVLFCLSIFLLATLTVFQYVTDWSFELLFDIKKMALLSTVIFFILWTIERAENILQNSLPNKMFGTSNG